MKSIAIVISALLSFSLFAEPISIVSGRATGTNYPMTEDIKRACSSVKSPITNISSDGSIDNLEKMYADPSKILLGIARVDALEYFRSTNPKKAAGVLVAMPFSSDEIHLIVRDDSKISSLSELDGKKVVEGPVGSGTWITVQLIKNLTGIKWIPIIASQRDGLDLVLAGSADAEFIVAGKPISILETARGIKLIPVQSSKIDEFPLYRKTVISDTVYKFQKTQIVTYKIDNMIVTYAQRNQKAKEIKELVSCIITSVPLMQTTEGYHPKWRDVSISINQLDKLSWQLHPAGEYALKEYQATRRLPAQNQQNYFSQYRKIF